jgi:capsular polysaccharide transport system ATP-binding protein
MRRKARNAFKSLADRSGLLMVAHSSSTLKRFCESGIYLKDGNAYWFDDIKHAIKEYKKDNKRA